MIFVNPILRLNPYRHVAPAKTIGRQIWADPRNKVV